MGAFGTGTLLNRGKGFSWHQREGALFLCPWRKQSLPRTLRHQAVVEAQNLPPPLSFLQHPAPHGKKARAKANKAHLDNFVDDAAYSALAGEIAQR